MADLFDAMKNVANTVVQGYGMCDMELGKVISMKPPAIKISDRITLDEDQILLTQTVVQKTINCRHTHKSGEPDGLSEPIEVREGLAAGDEVLLLKVERGQKYIVLSKVVKA